MYPRNFWIKGQGNREESSYKLMQAIPCYTGCVGVAVWAVEEERLLIKKKKKKKQGEELRTQQKEELRKCLDKWND